MPDHLAVELGHERQARRSMRPTRAGRDEHAARSAHRRSRSPSHRRRASSSGRCGAEDGACRSPSWLALSVRALVPRSSSSPSCILIARSRTSVRPPSPTLALQGSQLSRRRTDNGPARPPPGPRNPARLVAAVPEPALLREPSMSGKRRRHAPSRPLQTDAAQPRRVDDGSAAGHAHQLATYGGVPALAVGANLLGQHLGCRPGRWSATTCRVRMRRPARGRAAGPISLSAARRCRARDGAA